MGIQGSTWTPSSQMQGFGAGPSSFQRTRIEKPPDTHEYTEGIGVVLSNESTKLDVIPVSVSQSFQVSHGSQASQGCHGSQGSQGSQGFQASQAG